MIPAGRLGLERGVERCSHVAGSRQRNGAVGEDSRDAGMRRPQRLPGDVEGLLEERQAVVDLPEMGVRVGRFPEAVRDDRMARPENALPDLQRLSVELQGLAETARLVE